MKIKLQSVKPQELITNRWYLCGETSLPEEISFMATAVTDKAAITGEEAFAECWTLALNGKMDLVPESARSFVEARIKGQ